MGAMLLALMWLAACTAPPASSPPVIAEEAAEATVAANAAEPASRPTAQAAPTPADQGNGAQVDASQLPADVRDFILKQRMCRHFSRNEAEGGNPAMASMMCAGADEAAWKTLVRKYQDDDTVASVLLAERPASNPAK